MGDTLITVIGIFLAATLMFVFPLLAVSERNDDISQLNVQALTTEFVDTIRTSGKLTRENYEVFIQQLGATGNSYDVELEFKIQDTNPAKKAMSGTSFSKIGENVYYSVYTSQIEDVLNEIEKNNVYLLKEGDIVTCNVKNTNTTISQSLRSFLYKIGGDDTHQIAATQTGIVMSTGK